MRLRTTTDIGALVRDTRRRAGMTQLELARHLRVSGRAIAALEEGKDRVDVGLVLRVLGVLDICLDATVEGEGSLPIDLDALIRAHLPVEPWNQPPHQR